ncbi:heavy metal translocating P-type ATPase [Candidatus Foliamicus sp.]
MEQEAQRPAEQQGPDTQRLDLVVEGMTCSACSARLEKVLNNTDGIKQATVSLALERAILHIDLAHIDIKGSIEAVRRCGFRVGTEIGEYHVENLGAEQVAERVSDALASVPGVIDIEFDTQQEQLRITVASSMAVDAALIERARVAGFELVPSELVVDEEGKQQAAREPEHIRRERRAIFAAIALTTPFLLQMVVMFAFGETAMHLHMPPWFELVLAIPIQFVLGWRFYRGAFNSLRGGGANMDVLVAMGTSAAFAYSLYMLISLGAASRGQLFFEASAMIITLVMIGKYFEARAKRGAAAAIQELMALQPDTALVRLPNGDVEERRGSLLALGDVIVCRPGDRIAADGVIVRGEAELDESLLTGESNPVPKGEGDKVIAGAINADGFIDVEVTAVAGDSTLARMIKLVEDAQISKPAVQRLVDRVSAVFVPVVVSIAIVTFVGWLLSGAELGQAVLSAAAVLVIACPCALGLATPTAIMTGSSAAARAGILIKDTATLERAHSIDHVVFDKTGTLTQGKPSVAETELMAGLTEDEVLRIAASLQQGSEHPIALAFREEVERRGIALDDIDRFKNSVSRGIEADIGGVRYLVGNDRLYRDKGLDPPPRELERGGTEVWLGVSLEGGDALLARFELVDELRPTAKAAVSNLDKLGIAPMLVSGDANSVAERVGADLGIKPDMIYGQAKPEDKARIIAELADDGAQVGMVGDGVNDAPALAQASVGIALGTGTGVAMETAAVTLMRPDPRLVASAIDISKRTFRKIKQNLFWAFIYNVVGLPLAAFGFLSPTLAGAAMAFSSVSVVSNSLTLRRWRANLA